MGGGDGRVVVSPLGVTDLADRLGVTALTLSELSCRVRAAGAPLGCVPAADRIDTIQRWCEDTSGDLRLLVDRAVAVDHRAAVDLATASVAVGADGPGQPWGAPVPPRNHLAEAIGGFADAAEGSADAFNRLALRWIWDPGAWWGDLGRVGQGMGAAVRDPRRAARRFLDLDTLEDNPARWVGGLGPDAVLGAMTAGAGAAGRRGADLADDLHDLSRWSGDAVASGNRRSLAGVAGSPDGATLRRAVGDLRVGEAGNSAVRVVESVADLADLMGAIRSSARPVDRPSYPGEWWVLPDGTGVGRRHSGASGPTIDIRFVQDGHWKLHVAGR